MLEAPMYADEMKRLKTLLELQILDTLPEPKFDEITNMASIVCQTPIALISIVDKDRQWFKSKIGLDVNETPRNISFCGHAIYGNDIMIVEDARQDERFKDNPLVTGDLKILFYAGVPLTTPLGQNIGTLCVIDHKKRTLTKEQINCIKALSRLVVTYFISNQQNQIIRMLNEETQKLAAKINLSSEHLVKTSKLASLVEIAAGVAHEINNPLTIIQGKSQLVLNMLGKDNLDLEKAKQYLKTVCTTSQRVSRIINGLKSFARDDTNEPKFFANLLKIVKESIDILEIRLEKIKIKIEINISESINIQCSSTQISQCIVNLISNSIDALEELENKWIKVDADEQDEFVEIKVTDSGIGIRDTKIIDRLMEPFFTTKEVGRGVGLGLSIIKGIVDTHKGKFFYNEKFENTQFVIRLPKIFDDLGGDA